MNEKRTLFTTEEGGLLRQTNHTLSPATPRRIHGASGEDCVSPISYLFTAALRVVLEHEGFKERELVLPGGDSHVQPGEGRGGASSQVPLCRTRNCNAIETRTRPPTRVHRDRRTVARLFPLFPGYDAWTAVGCSLNVWNVSRGFS